MLAYFENKKIICMFLSVFGIDFASAFYDF